MGMMQSSLGSLYRIPNANGQRQAQLVDVFHLVFGPPEPKGSSHVMLGRDLDARPRGALIRCAVVTMIKEASSLQIHFKFFP